MIDNGVTVAGAAQLIAASRGRLVYREDGRMRLPGGAQVDAYADYLLDQDGETLRMWFAETPPRLFQAFRLKADDDGLSGESRHDCPPDTYDSRIVFTPQGLWTLDHRVAGPRKGYASRTTYRRAP